MYKLSSLAVAKEFELLEATAKLAVVVLVVVAGFVVVAVVVVLLRDTEMYLGCDLNDGRSGIGAQIPPASASMIHLILGRDFGLWRVHSNPILIRFSMS